MLHFNVYIWRRKPLNLLGGIVYHLHGESGLESLLYALLWIPLISFINLLRGGVLLNGFLGFFYLGIIIQG